jgi:hypothetical protein
VAIQLCLLPRVSIVVVPKPSRQLTTSSDDMYAPESIELLKKSGIDFKRHEEDGINPLYFGELLVTSGLVLFDSVKWVSFHS